MAGAQGVDGREGERMSHDPHYEPPPVCPNCGGDAFATFKCAGCGRDLCYNCHANGKSHHCADCGWVLEYCLACCELMGEDWACQKHAENAREAVKEACPACKGTGSEWPGCWRTEKCEECNGSGITPNKKGKTG
jgi:hypothetical protein